ncbi:MAG TPA: SAM-dependent methyltransferase [Puia sp.]|nr:SAM-dependent methyltransferase [Puia sp.]
MQESQNLAAIIVDKIRAGGPIPFSDFMELALYHPQLGYYTSARDQIGEDGDFFTSPCLTGLFGDLLGRQFEEMWQLLGGVPFTIVEIGAGTGVLCRDILSRLKEVPEMYRKLNYLIIEKSESMRQRERRLLPEKVGWAASLGEIGEVTGCIFSNELVDNFSVHRVVMQQDLMEVCVDFEGGFREVLQPASDELRDYLARLGVVLAPGQEAEINLEATAWIQEVAATLRRGWVITIDYGHTACDLYSRKSGTLACFHRHRVHHCPYDFIGEQDITSHVNFTALDHWGRRRGLEVCGYTNQTHFLQGLGLAARLRQWEDKDPGDHEMARLRTFLLEMGQKFRVLIQQKGVGRTFLSGLQFARVCHPTR